MHVVNKPNHFVLHHESISIHFCLHIFFVHKNLTYIHVCVCVCVCVCISCTICRVCIFSVWEIDLKFIQYGKTTFPLKMTTFWSEIFSSDIYNYFTLCKSFKPVITGGFH